MGDFKEHLDAIDDADQQDKVNQILTWIQESYPELETRIKWNQPMFLHEGTYIIGFSYSKHHIAVAPETKAIKKFKDYIEETGFSYTDNIIKIRWEDSIPYNLIKELIEYNIEDKKGYEKFWR